MGGWKEVKNGQRVELALLQIDIHDSSKIVGAPLAIKRGKDKLADMATRRCETYGGKQMSWAGDGGMYMWLARNPDVFDNLAMAGIDILSGLAPLNMELEAGPLRKGFDIRISGHAGGVIYDRNHGRMHSAVLNDFFKNERKLSAKSSVSLTNNVFENLSTTIQDRFAKVDVGERTVFRYHQPSGGPEVAVQGRWSTSSPVTNRGRNRYREVFVIQQSGDRISGQLLCSESAWTNGKWAAPESVDFDIEARVRSRILTGRYWSKDGSSASSGAFAFEVSLNAKTMTGGCIYYDSASRRIESDRYELKKEESAL